MIPPPSWYEVLLVIVLLLMVTVPLRLARPPPPSVGPAVLESMTLLLMVTLPVPYQLRIPAPNPTDDCRRCSCRSPSGGRRSRLKMPPPPLLPLFPSTNYTIKGQDAGIVDAAAKIALPAPRR